MSLIKELKLRHNLKVIGENMVEYYLRNDLMDKFVDDVYNEWSSYPECANEICKYANKHLKKLGKKAKL